LLFLAAGYAVVNGIIWAVLFGRKSWRGIPWMAFSLGSAFLIPISPVLLLFLANDWQSCMKSIFIPGTLIGLAVLLNVLLREYDKSLVFSASAFFCLLTGTVLAINGLTLSILEGSNIPQGNILMLIGGIGLGIIGLGFGVLAFFAYVLNSQKSADPTPIDISNEFDIQEQGIVASVRKPSSRRAAAIFGVGSCLLGIGFLGSLALIIAAVVAILWLFKDFSPNFIL
jgi:hypothetical protein